MDKMIEELAPEAGGVIKLLTIAETLFITSYTPENVLDGLHEHFLHTLLSPNQREWVMRYCVERYGKFMIEKAKQHDG